MSEYPGTLTGTKHGRIMRTGYSIRGGAPFLSMKLKNVTSHLKNDTKITFKKIYFIVLLF